ncbi:hypothetical protein M758_3G249900 [Ceratodon purpureus]|nr:hypothetical protein M758_3G249900 [Ceratodon purpureus]
MPIATLPSQITTSSSTNLQLKTNLQNLPQKLPKHSSKLLKTPQNSPKLLKTSTFEAPKLPPLAPKLGEVWVQRAVPERAGYQVEAKAGYEVGCRWESSYR